MLSAVERGAVPLDVYADWLEERADPLSVGVRWLATNGKSPIRNADGCEWYRRDRFPNQLMEFATLPSRIYCCLDPIYAGPLCSSPTYLQAVQVAARAAAIAAEREEESAIEELAEMVDAAIIGQARDSPSLRDHLRMLMYRVSPPNDKPFRLRLVVLARDLSDGQGQFVDVWTDGHWRWLGSTIRSIDARRGED